MRWPVCRTEQVSAMSAPGPGAARPPAEGDPVLANAALERLSPTFAKLHSAIGRSSIPPEQLLPALLLQTFFTARSER